jgi:prepilin-type processing-associated H-X9-DG protein
MRRRGITLVEVLVLIGVVCLVLAGLVLPVLQRMREGSGRVRCASNLRQIGLYMQMYANDDLRVGAFPRTLYVPDAPPTAYTQPLAPDPFKPGGPVNDVTAALWWLLRSSDMSPDTLRCEHTDARAADARTVRLRSNFESQATLSYAFANPYPSTAASDAGYVWARTMDGQFALAADMPPDQSAVWQTPADAPPEAIRKLNSPNNQSNGQNVLFADGHVEFAMTPFVGRDGDQIFVVSDASQTPQRLLAPVGSPAGPHDSVLLPAWDPAFDYPAPSGDFPWRTLPWLFGGVAGCLTIWIAYRFTAARRHATNGGPAGSPPGTV